MIGSGKGVSADGGLCYCKSMKPGFVSVLSGLQCCVIVSLAKEDFPFSTCIPSLNVTGAACIHCRETCSWVLNAIVNPTAYCILSTSENTLVGKAVLSRKHLYNWEKTSRAL